MIHVCLFSVWVDVHLFATAKHTPKAHHTQKNHTKILIHEICHINSHTLFWVGFWICVIWLCELIVAFKWNGFKLSHIQKRPHTHQHWPNSTNDFSQRKIFNWIYACCFSIAKQIPSQTFAFAKHCRLWTAEECANETYITM